MKWETRANRVEMISEEVDGKKDRGASCAS
jgi:hypothetical protein